MQGCKAGRRASFDGPAAVLEVADVAEGRRRAEELGEVPLHFRGAVGLLRAPSRGRSRPAWGEGLDVPALRKGWLVERQAPQPIPTVLAIAVGQSSVPRLDVCYHVPCLVLGDAVAQPLEASLDVHLPKKA